MAFGELVAVIGGIVEHLNLQKLARVLDLNRFGRSAAPARIARYIEAAGW